MAIGSVLNPERIVGKQNTNQQLAKNFISGDSFLGTSSIASAANKIVGFQRGTAKPVPSSVDSIVSTISTNITNNITSTLNNTLQSFTADYKKRVSDVESAKPTGILSKFLSTYKSVIQFIQFFGNKKFVNGISDNLKNLSKSFTESFEVAKLIRQVIVKIVKQLSNLPKATPGGGGGIDIDVDVPMGGVRKSAPRGLGNMFKGRGKMLALGAGALGVGAVGAGTVNALSNVDEIRAGMFQPGDGGDIISIFGSAIERFIAAINTMVGIGKGTKPPSGGGGGSGGGGSSSGGGGRDGTPVVSTGTAGENLAAFTSTLEASGAQNQADVMQVMINRAAKNHSGYGDLFGQVTAREQFSPISSAIYVESADKDAQKIYGPIAAKLGKNPQERIAKLKEISEGPNGLENLAKMFGGGDPSSALKVLEDFKTQGVMSQTSARDIGGGLYFRGRKYEGGGVYFDRGSNKFIGGKGKGPSTLGQVSAPKPGIGGSYDELTPESAAAYMSGKLEQYKNLATNVSQPAQTVAQSQTNIVPIDLSGTMPQQSQGGGGGVSAPPATQKNGPSVPLLPSANTDNFLVLYSRMVYNIVDG
jgi:hypothetical protein